MINENNIVVPKTEGIKYAGSKLKILPYIVKMIKDLDIKSALDGFSGTTRVSQAFSQLGYNTTSNDISEWSKVFATCYLLANKSNIYYQEIIDELNSLPGQYGWFSENYGGEGKEGKKPFQLKNTMKLDSIREEIDKYDLEYEDKCVILTSLIYAMDSVDNTIGHYASYLSGWSPRSNKDMVLKMPNKFPITTINEVTQGDVFDIIGKYHDLVYFDPPYGSNNEKMPSSRVRYAAFYHLWKTIILNDRPQVFGKVNRREDSRDTISKSVFEEFKKNDKGNFIAMQAIKDLIEKTNAHYILLSYSSGGRASKKELFDIINNSCKLIDTCEIDYKQNVMSNMRWTNEWVTTDTPYKEYLFLMEK